MRREGFPRARDSASSSIPPAAIGEPLSNLRTRWKLNSRRARARASLAVMANASTVIKEKKKEKKKGKERKKNGRKRRKKEKVPARLVMGDDKAAVN